MIPYLHIGPLTIPTFGLLVASGLLVAAYVLQADFNRRKLSADAFMIIGIAGLAGLAGARLYHVLESPREFFADPWPLLFSRFGFAWFGGLLGGFVALVILARQAKIPMLEFLDACSPAGAAGYAIGRIGCFLSGDGDYGVPTSLPWGMSFPNGVVPTFERVHPTPLYELLIWLAIAAFLWRMGAKALRAPKYQGKIFCGYLLFTGLARFLIEFIRVNPRLVLEERHFHWIDYETYSRLASHSWFSFSNAQTASLVSILVGALLLGFLKAHSKDGKKNTG